MIRAIFSLLLVVGLAIAIPQAGRKNQLDLTNAETMAKVTGLAMFTISTYNTRSNDLAYQELIVVEDASSQLVSGITYDITFTVGQSVCMKNMIGQHDVNKNTCPINSKALYHRCTASIWEKSWASTLQITDHTCTKISAKDANSK